MKMFASGLLITAIAILLAPIFLYWVGLYVANGKPTVPSELFSKDAQLATWLQFEGEGEPRIHKLNPYSYYPALLKLDASAIIVGGIASSYVKSCRRFQGRWWGYLASASLSVWLSRNWSTGQLMTYFQDKIWNKRLNKPNIDSTLKRC